MQSWTDTDTRPRVTALECRKRMRASLDASIAATAAGNPAEAARQDRLYTAWAIRLSGAAR